MVKNYLKLFLLFILLGMSLAFSKINNTIFILIIISIYFLITIIYKIINKQKYENIIPENKYHKMKYLSITISIIIFIISLVVNKNALTITNNLYESISLFVINILLTYPISPCIYTKEKDLYNLSCTKTIVSETVPFLADTVFLNKMGINLIIFNKKALSKNLIPYFKETNTASIKKNKNTNLYISKYNKEDLKKITTENTIVTKDISSTLLTIKKSRGIIDNIIRILKINDIISYSLSLLIMIPLLYGFPKIFNNNLLLFLSLIIYLINNYLLTRITFDFDVYNRRPRSTNDPLFTKQEILFNIISTIAIFICISTIYMATLSRGANLTSAASICLNIYIISFIMLILINYSESLTIINIFKIFYNIYSIIIIFLLLLLTIVIKYIPLINIDSIGFNNYRSTIVLAILCTIWYDLTKIARYFKNRKKEEYVKTN